MALTRKKKIVKKDSTKKKVSTTKNKVNSKNNKSKKKYFATGRRKTSVARVILTSGKGDFTINKKKASEYVINNFLLNELLKPFKLTNNLNKYDVVVNVYGGGFSSQIGAIRLGIARALLSAGIEHKILKSFGLLTRDSRAKERKKYGLKAARKASQFSKR